MDEPEAMPAGGHVVLCGLNELGYRTLEELVRLGTLNPDVRVVLRLFDPDLAARVERAFGIHISRIPRPWQRPRSPPRPASRRRPLSPSERRCWPSRGPWWRARRRPGLDRGRGPRRPPRPSLTPRTSPTVHHGGGCHALTRPMEVLLA